MKQQDNDREILEKSSVGQKVLATDEIIKNQEGLIVEIIKANNATIEIIQQFQNEIQKEKCDNLPVTTHISAVVTRLKDENQKLYQKLNSDDQSNINLTYVKELQMLNEKIKSHLNDWLQSKDQTTDYLFSLLNQIINLNDYQKQMKFQYINVVSHKIKTQKFCFSLAFNENASLLFIGLDDGKIKGYAFKNWLKLIYIVQKHTRQVSCLIWLKKSNSFVSGSNDKSIIIWSKNENNSWQPHQRLQGHEGNIFSMVVNEDEVLLITGSEDRTIKFWKKQENQYWILQQTIRTAIYNYGLSLNSSSTMLISCGYPKGIKLIEYKNDSQLWVLTETINVEEWGYRVNFLNDYQFIFQPIMIGSLEMYNYEQEKKIFLRTNQTKVNSCYYCDYYFPSQFLKKENILSVKHGKCINFFQFDQNGELVLKYSLEFRRSEGLYGKLTQNGQFLAIWDWDSKNVQIRKLTYL